MDIEEIQLQQEECVLSEKEYHPVRMWRATLELFWVPSRKSQ